MIVLALLLIGAGLVLLIRLAVLLGIHALPLFVAAAVVSALHPQGGAGLAAALALGAAAGALALFAAHLAFAAWRAPAARAGVGLVFAAPAAFAGYHLAHGAAAVAAAPELGRQLGGLAAAALVGHAAWRRLSQNAAAAPLDPALPWRGTPRPHD
jgi:hypothetical protein